MSLFEVRVLLEVPLRAYVRVRVCGLVCSGVYRFYTSPQVCGPFELSFTCVVALKERQLQSLTDGHNDVILC